MSDKIFKTKTVLALGYFDSVHIGHQKVLSSAKEYADKMNATLTVVTFSGNLKGLINGDGDKAIYSDIERESLYYSLGVDDIYFAPLTKEFLSLNENEFLEHVNNKFNVLAYCSGTDYRFGKNGKGNAQTIKEYAKNNGQDYLIVQAVKYGDEKVSSTLIKSLLRSGFVDKANLLLGRKYSVSGVVFSDRKVGKSLGFPTVNIKIDKEKFEIKKGVYQGYVTVENKSFKSLINYGARPTFNLDVALIEAHLIDFDGDLYDKEIKVSFDKFLREIQKFDSFEQLKDRLRKDLEKVRESND